MLELTKLPAHYLEKYGREKVAEVTGRDASAIAMWISRGNFPLAAVESLLAFDPAPLHAIKPLYEVTEVGSKLIILMPLSTPPAPKSMDCVIALHDRREMSFRRFSFNNLSVARNTAAAHWLRGPWEWAYWCDGDMYVPFGDAETFKREAELPQLPDIFAGMNTIYRLLAHKLKRGIDARMIGVPYVTRNSAAIPQYGGVSESELRSEMRRGPRDQIKEVPWIGFGGVLMHRTVMEDVIKTQGDEIRMKSNGVGGRFNYQYGIFDPLGAEVPGDDIPACHRITKAGHKIYVDFSIAAAHVGDRPFTYKDVV